MAYAQSRSGYPSTTATGRVADNLALYGHTRAFDEPEDRPIPEEEDLSGVIASLFSDITGPLSETGLEPELEDVLWSFVDVFHRKVDRMQRRLDDNEMRIRTAQEGNDGSEIASVELERLVAMGENLIARRDAFEHMRDRAAQEFEDATASTWRPRTTSMVNHKKTTAALIQSRDYISAKRRSETEVLLPPGPKVAFTGGQDCNDHKQIWDVLDKVFAKHPDMVLIHSGNRVGADAIAAAWAKARKVTPIAFTPKKTSATDKSAVFKRNDDMLAAMPIGVIVFPGNGINANLADKAKKLRIPVIDMRGPQKAAA